MHNIIKINISIFCFLLLSINIFTQELPPIQSFTSKEYGAENQNWAISQSENKNIYVANNKGLLEFNGASWQLYPTPNETIMRSVKVFGNMIFTGFYMDFGFWQKNNFGVLEFTSIVKKKKLSMLEDEQIWNILEADGWMIFKSLNRIYLYNLETEVIKIINAENTLYKISKVNGSIYFQESGKGVFKIENGFPKLVSSNTVLKDNALVGIYSQDNYLVFLTQKQGFYKFIDNQVLRWRIPSKNIFKDKTIYSAIQTNKGNFVLGTISSGLVYLNKNGEINYSVSQNSGLNNNTVLSVFEDVDNNLWLGLDNGINCINNASPFKIFNKKSDVLGTIYASKVFKEYLYIGTNQGLFYKKLNSSDNYKFIENTQGQVWSLNIINGTLFCGHDSGAFTVLRDKAVNIFSNFGAWDIKKIDSFKLLLGTYEGVFILEFKNNSWQVRNKIEGFNNSSKQFVIQSNNKVFVNHEYKGVFILKVDNDWRKVVEIKKESSIEKGIHSSLLSYNNQILYANINGVYIFNSRTNSFVKDSVYSQLIDKDNFISAHLTQTKYNNRLWSFSKDGINYLSPGKLSNKPIISKIPISSSIPKAASGYENIIHIHNEKYLVGTSDGYLEIDLNGLEDSLDFNVYLYQVKNFERGKKKINVDLLNANQFKFNQNNLEFFFSSPNFNKILNTKYQYQLSNFNDNWSNPSESKSVVFENIPPGSYSFKVRSMLGAKISREEAIFNFKILKPWYLSNLMKVVYFLSIILLLFILHIFSKRYYKKQREELLVKTQKELELKELESSQKIIKLNNDKLRNDIESKNRELATSTMNIIKKNEFLNNIKNELKTEGDITKVVKIIDKNLNNTDDWKMFQEAFNNADKKFLKKVKAKHPELTPNDLRLCAYLRLNLSSKEIAPLLNISPRSVEVKRYRLRKKINLPHDLNLTNYILEI